MRRRVRMVREPVEERAPEPTMETPRATGMMVGRRRVTVDGLIDPFGSPSSP